MSNSWEYYGSTPLSIFCDFCHYYGHWSYECNYAPQYPTTPYDAQWEDSTLYQGYADNRGEAYGSNFQEWEFHQSSQYQQVGYEKSMDEKLDKILSLLKEMEETRSEGRKRQEEYIEGSDHSMYQFHATVEEIEDDEGTLECCSRSECLCLAKQSLVADGKNPKDEGEGLNFANHDPILEPFKPIYTEQDYVLEFDDFSEIDEKDLLDRECVEGDSTQEIMETNAKDGFDDFDGVEMSDNEIKESTNCLQLEEEVSIMETSIRKKAMEANKCEEKKISHMSFEDDRVVVPDIITWYKDRGKYFPQHLY